ncbi:MAG TPA: serine hydrolase, partial [Terriglobales bacterium]
RLDLNAPVHSIAPEVQFQNPWEATDPVRVVHLLEHTTGWDDLRFKEYASSDPKPLTLEEGLNIDPVSRTSRWKPGTRFSYCNSGPAVAAFLVQKITGQRFEDYVKEKFFSPIGMTTADYFYSPETQKLLTNLYKADGKTPYPYWHISMRPAGSINASAKEMGYYIQFFLNRGSVRGVQLVPKEAIDRMETPATYYGAQAGLKTGYGLHNYTTQDDNGFVWHGHNGGVEGGLSEMAYLPNQGVGYFFSINAGSGKAMDKIAKLMQSYVTKDIQKPELPAVSRVPQEVAKEYGGWYQGISPRTQILYFIDRIAGLSRVTVEENKLTLKPLFGNSRTYVPVTDHLFRTEKESAASLALMKADEGLLVQTSGTTRELVPSWLVYSELALVALTALALASTALFALIWIPRLLFRRMRGVKYLQVRVLPFMAVLCLAGAAATVIFGSQDFLRSFGTPSVYAYGLTFFTLAFAAASVLGLFAFWRADPRDMNKGVYWHSFFTSLLCTLMTIYLMYFGIIGYRSWV